MQISNVPIKNNDQATQRSKCCDAFRWRAERLRDSDQWARSSNAALIAKSNEVNA
jgi:hypothetical protein